jgi:hypothetical protein
MVLGPSVPLRFAQDDGAGDRRIWRSKFRLWKSGRMHKDAFLSDESMNHSSFLAKRLRFFRVAGRKIPGCDAD